MSCFFVVNSLNISKDSSVKCLPPTQTNPALAAALDPLVTLTKLPRGPWSKQKVENAYRRLSFLTCWNKQTGVRPESLLGFRELILRRYGALLTAYSTPS